LCGGVPGDGSIRTPDFSANPEKSATRDHAETKMISSTARNSTGLTASESDLRDVAKLAAKQQRGVVVGRNLTARVFYDGSFTHRLGQRRNHRHRRFLSNRNAMNRLAGSVRPRAPRVISTMLKIRQYSMSSSGDPAAGRGERFRRLEDFHAC